MLVIGIAFGWAIIISVATVLSGPAAADAVPRGDTFGKGHLYGVVITELICMPLVASILYVRGWRLADFPLGIGKSMTLLGLSIALGVWLLDAFLGAAFEALFSSLRPALDGLDSYKPRNPPDLIAIYILSVVNPVFEEVIVCGYVMPALSRRFGVTAAVNVSVVIRVAYHLYQGIAAAPFHLAYGLVQAYTFVRFGRLWPLIVSHAVLDFTSLLYYM